MRPIQDNIIDEIRVERSAQDAKWGVQSHHPAMWLTILTEEVGEAARSFLDKKPLAYREEMIQVAAVALAMIECYDRGQGGF